MSVLVYIDSDKGKLKKSAQEVATYGSKLASSLGVPAVGVAMGEISNEALSALGAYGLSKVLKVGSAELTDFSSKAYTKAIASAAEAEGSTVVVVSYNVNGKALAGRLASRMKAGVVGGAIALPNTADGFTVRKSVFSGKAFADVKILTEKKIIGLNPNSLPVEKGEGVVAEVVEHDAGITSADIGVKVLEQKKQTGTIPLAEAELVVSGGRGLRGPENWGMIEELAGLLGAATACSRAVADVHWRPHHEHVGQTGGTIRPNLYIAIAISGAIQHLAGVNNSKTIVVINKDSEAPFFKAADYGVVGDAFEVVPRLIEAVKKHQASS